MQMQVMINRYRPGVDLEQLDIDGFCLEFVKAEWLEKRDFENIKLAVNQGMAGKPEPENEDMD